MIFLFGLMYPLVVITIRSPPVGTCGILWIPFTCTQQMHEEVNLKVYSDQLTSTVNTF